MSATVKTFRARVGPYARFVRHLPARLLHPWRRSRAVARLQSMPRPGRVLFVCYGNICRSPYGAEVLRKAADAEHVSGLSVASAGFFGPDRPSPPAALAVARRRGHDLGEHRSRLLTPENLAETDLVVVMDRGQRTAIRRQYQVGGDVVLLGDFDPQPIETRAVRDPYGQDEAVFDRVYERVDRCVDLLLRSLPPARTSAGAG